MCKLFLDAVEIQMPRANCQDFSTGHQIFLRVSFYMPILCIIYVFIIYEGPITLMLFLVIFYAGKTCTYAVKIVLEAVYSAVKCRDHTSFFFFSCINICRVPRKPFKHEAA